MCTDSVSWSLLFAGEIRIYTFYPCHLRSHCARDVPENLSGVHPLLSAPSAASAFPLRSRRAGKTFRRTRLPSAVSAFPLRLRYLPHSQPGFTGSQQYLHEFTIQQLPGPAIEGRFVPFNGIKSTICLDKLHPVSGKPNFKTMINHINSRQKGIMPILAALPITLFLNPAVAKAQKVYMIAALIPSSWFWC